MSTAGKQTGSLGENAACKLLSARGYRIVSLNYHAGRWGEIDIVARDGETLVFIEVKTRRGQACGLPEEAVTESKLRKLCLAAEHYLLRHNLIDQDYRIDIVALGLSDDDRVIYQNLLQNVTF